jgi:hypothetical protein
LDKEIEMEKQTVIFDKVEPKKNSLCFKTTQEDPAITSVYVMKYALGKPFPAKIKVTIEEVE